MSSPVLAVNEDDRVIGEVPRRGAHTGEGTRHRAFTVAVADTDSNLLLARRSEEKLLWNGYWDGTVASHPGVNESVEDSVQNRLTHELGITNGEYDDLIELEKFEYQAEFRDVGVEWEICYLYKVLIEKRELSPNSDEVDAVRWYSIPGELDKVIATNSLPLCPWFRIAYPQLKDSFN